MAIKSPSAPLGAAARRRRRRLTQFYSVARFVAWTACPAIALFLFATLDGARLHGADMRQRVFEEADGEDAALCRKLGIAEGTHEHVVCKMDLLDLRRRHEQRLQEAMGGVL